MPRLRIYVSRSSLSAILLAALLVGCGPNSARGGDHQLDAVAERVMSASLQLASPVAAAGASTPTPTGRQPGSSATISAGGTGVSLRSDCLDAARSGGGWPDGAVVVVTESGTERCNGWVRATREGATSWVRSEYLTAGATAAANTSAPASSSQDPVKDIRLQVTSLKEAAWRVGFLLRRTPGQGLGVMTPTYLAADATRARE